MRSSTCPYGALVIVHVFHGARDMAALAERGKFKSQNPPENAETAPKWRPFFDAQAKARTDFDDLREKAVQALINEAVSGVRRRSK